MVINRRTLRFFGFGGVEGGRVLDAGGGVGGTFPGEIGEVELGVAGVGPDVEGGGCSGPVWLAEPRGTAGFRSPVLPLVLLAYPL